MTAGTPQPIPWPEPTVDQHRVSRGDSPPTRLDAESPLDGVERTARLARGRLLGELLADGCTIDELQTAVAADRIALLPTERLLSGGEPRLPRYYTPEDLAELSGVDIEDLRAIDAALGLPLAPAGAQVHTRLDLELAEQAGGQAVRPPVGRQAAGEQVANHPDRERGAVHRGQPIRRERVHDLAPAGPGLDPRGRRHRIHANLTVVQGQPQQDRSPGSGRASAR